MGLVAPGEVSWVRNSIHPAPTGVPIPTLVPILVGLVLSIVCWTMVNTWVYNSTESVLLMILLHGWYNTDNAYLVLSSQNALAQTLSGILPWALAIVLLRAYGRTPRRQAPTESKFFPATGGWPGQRRAFRKTRMIASSRSEHP